MLLEMAASNWMDETFQQNVHKERFSKYLKSENTVRFLTLERLRIDRQTKWIKGCNNNNKK